MISSAQMNKVPPYTEDSDMTNGTFKVVLYDKSARANKLLRVGSLKVTKPAEMDFASNHSPYFVV